MTTSSIAACADSMSDAQRDIFRFFDLPREMRDKILDDVEPDTLYASLLCHLEVKCPIARPNLLGVSKDFRQEYEESLLRTPRYLTVSDLFTNLDFKDRWFLPPALTKCTHININMVFEADTGVEDELNFMKEWVTFVLDQLKSTQALHIRLDIQEQDVAACLQAIKDKVNVGFWLTIPALKSFSMYASDTYATCDFEGEPKMLLAELSSETKQLEVVKQEG